MADPPKRQRRRLTPGFYARYQDRQVSTEQELRKLFADANILQLENQGKLTKEEVRGEFTVKLDNEPDFVRTVITIFRTHDKVEVARTHHYERRNGTRAASGLLDPKRVLVDGVLYYQEK
jgi:hypothetical protein